MRLTEREIADKRRSLFRLLKVYGIGIALPLVASILFIFFMFGYALGYLDGTANRPQIMESK